MMVTATIVCVIATLVLVLAEYRAAKRLRRLAKPIASLAFIAVGWPGIRCMPYELWIFVGLVLGGVGDVALLGASNTAFMAGLVAFLLGHLSYVVAIAQWVPQPDHWWSVYALVTALVGTGALAWLWRHLGSMKVPVILYVATIVTMVAAAFATHDVRLISGALLFFASDLSVARDKFVAPGFANRAWGLPCYYAGQLLIAWSLH